MKSPIMLACVMVAAMGMTVMAEEAAPAAGAPVVKAEKGKHAAMTPEQREAMIAKRLEAIKAKDEAKYNELVALKASDPEAFKTKMREMGRGEHGKGKKGEAPATK
ncbi:MAG: hypothetical protein WCK89_18970 [bacterium]